MASRVDPDEMAHYEPSHLDLHCLHRYLFWSTGLKGLFFHLQILFVSFQIHIGQLYDN